MHHLITVIPLTATVNVRGGGGGGGGHFFQGYTVVPQAAEFTYILFTQEIRTRDTSGQHGLSDLNKRYFQLEFS